MKRGHHQGPIRAALYVRVSTADKQHPANQTAPLRALCKKQGWKIVHEFVDRESGGSSDRAQFQAMMTAASRWEIDLVLCWSLDRFSREGIAATFTHLKRLKSYQVDFYSLTEEYFRTVGPAADLLIAVTAWVAEYERRRRQERIKAGLDRARAEGVQIGRRRNSFRAGEIDSMVGMHRAGRSLRAIAAEFRSTKSTVGRRIAEAIKAATRKKAS